MGVSAAGAGVPAVRSGGDDAEAGGAGAVYLLVSGVPEAVVSSELLVVS